MLIGMIANGYTSPISGNPTGVAYPVVILIVVTLLMIYLAKRRRFGRYVYAYGGNPEAAELSGIDTRRTVMLTFVLMGVLVAVSAAIQTDIAVPSSAIRPAVSAPMASRPKTAAPTSSPIP